MGPPLAAGCCRWRHRPPVHVRAAIGFALPATTVIRRGLPIAQNWVPLIRVLQEAPMVARALSAAIASTPTVVMMLNKDIKVDEHRSTPLCTLRLLRLPGYDSRACGWSFGLFKAAATAH